jgi:dephospho-CoA kinase
MLRVGLTGGIGAGKTTVARLFAERGAPVFDADEVARRVTEAGQPALAEIVRAFGTGVLTADGTLDRTALRRLVFADPEARHRLEAIVHPKVYSALEHWLQGTVAPYCLLCIPLLLESGRLDLVDRVLVVDCPEALQIERVRRRNGLSEAEIRAILATQVSRADRLAKADDLIVNAGTLDALARAVESLDQKYRALGSGLTNSGESRQWHGSETRPEGHAGEEVAVPPASSFFFSSVSQD